MLYDLNLNIQDFHLGNSFTLRRVFVCAENSESHYDPGSWEGAKPSAAGSLRGRGKSPINDTLIYI